MLSKYSVKKPFTIFVAVVIVIVFGAIALYKMTPDLFPDVSAPYAIVTTTYPGASAEEVETELTDPIEQALATLSNVDNLTSQSSDNYSLITLEFTNDVDMDSISVDINDKIDQIEGNFPDGAGTPIVMKMSADMMPVTVAAISMKDGSAVDVSRLYNNDLENPLKGIEGVASVTAMGLVDEGIKVILSQDKIDEINDEISDQIRSNMNDTESDIKSGIKKVKNGKKKINKAEKQIKQTYEQIDSALSELESNKEDLENVLAQLEAQEEPDEEMISTVTAQLNAVNEAIAQLEAQRNDGEMAFQLSTTYTELATAKSQLQSTLSQLQSSLEEVENAKDAAIDSADMTGVITMENISAILSAQNFSMPAGYVKDGSSDVIVSVGDKITDEDEIKNLILFNLDIDGIDPIRVKDVAKVTYEADDSGTYAKVNGNNGVLVMLSKQSTYATAEVSDNIADKFSELESEYDGLEFTNLMDQGEYIYMVIDSVFENLILGGILAIIILFFFLRDIRPTIITAISIPISVIFAIAIMYFTGVTLNMISLSGLAIGIGMLVDNSIVVIENTYRLRSMGFTTVQAAVSGAGQVAGAIIASTLTTICVFAPIIFVTGMTKQIFKDLALTVTYSLLASLIIALSLVPAMAKGMLVRQSKHKTVLGQGGRVIRKYKKICLWALSHKKIVLASALLILIAATAGLLSRGFEFMSDMSSYQVSAEITTPEDSELEDTIRINDSISEEVLKIDGVETVGVMLSSDLMSMMGGNTSSTNQDVTGTEMYVVLDEDKAENSKKAEDLIKKLAEENDSEVTIESSDMTSMMSGSDITLNLYGDDLDKLRTTASNIEDKLNNVKSLEDVSDINDESTKEVHIVVNKNKAMRKGLTVAQVYQQVAAKLSEETTATSITEDDTDVDVKIENTTKDNFTKSDLKKIKLTVTNSDNTTDKVSLGNIASIYDDSTLDTIDHDDSKRTVAVTASLKDGYNVTKVTSQVKQLIKEQNLIPAGITVDYGGENEEIVSAMKQMIMMLAVGLVLVYLIMVAQFQSLRSPFIIIFTIPLAFTGGMLGLLICGQVLSVIGMMGFVMLMGIVVNNAIVLVDTINRLRLDGMDRDEAIVQAGAVRMRPVLMTASTTVLGLLPMALGMGTGSEMIQPVAIVCIGGLIYATLTTLLIVPVMYKLMSKKHMEKIADEELEIVTA